MYHAAGSGETTWAGFAQEAINQVHQSEPAAKLATVTGIPTIEFPTAAARPANSRLNCAKLEAVFGWKMMEWRQSLRNVLAEFPAS